MLGFSYHHCAIHHVSPYGCSHFDVHQNNTEAYERSLAELSAIVWEWRMGGVYARVWMILQARNRTAPSMQQQK